MVSKEQNYSQRVVLLVSLYVKNACNCAKWNDAQGIWTYFSTTEIQLATQWNPLGAPTTLQRQVVRTADAWIENTAHPSETTSTATGLRREDKQVMVVDDHYPIHPSVWGRIMGTGKISACAERRSTKNCVCIPHRLRVGNSSFLVVALFARQENMNFL